jgi:predicted RNA methylase
MQDTLIKETLEECAKRLEAYETPEWAVRAILEREILTHRVVDPCAGRNVMGRIAVESDYEVYASDVYDWEGTGKTFIQDWLNLRHVDQAFYRQLQPFTVLMNPPFSRACEFVEQAFHLGARKIVCFQRFAWWESKSRANFWQNYPPNRVYICGDRATCTRFDLIEQGYNGNTPTAHAWYVWESGHPSGTQLGHIYKSDV